MQFPSTTNLAKSVDSHLLSAGETGRRRLQSDFYASPRRLCTPGLSARAYDRDRNTLNPGDDNAFHYSPQEAGPPPVRWTVSTDIFDYRTVIFNFKDIHLPGILQPVLEVPPAIPPGVRNQGTVLGGRPEFSHQHERWPFINYYP